MSIAHLSSLGIAWHRREWAAYLVPEEEHAGAGIVQLIHGVEVGHLTYINQVHNRKVLELLRSSCQDLQAGASERQGPPGLPASFYWECYPAICTTYSVSCS